jgi:hypothetical protein
MMAGFCQCSDCRRANGAGHSTAIGVPTAAVTVTGTVKLYVKKAASGSDMIRAFCPECGSGVFSRSSGGPEMTFLRASTLDDPSVFKPQAVVFAKSAVAWDHLDPALMRFPEMPPAPPR